MNNTNLVSASALIAELGIPTGGESQRVTLARFNVVAAAAKPHSRGYIHFVTQEDADKIRRRVERAQKKAAPPELKLVATPVRALEDVTAGLAGQVAALTAEVRQMRADLSKLLKALGE